MKPVASHQTPNPSIERTHSGGAGLAQNEMKAKPAPPPRVRSMEGLGVVRRETGEL